MVLLEGDTTIVLTSIRYYSENIFFQRENVIDATRKNFLSYRIVETNSSRRVIHWILTEETDK